MADSDFERVLLEQLRNIVRHLNYITEGDDVWKPPHIPRGGRAWGIPVVKAVGDTPRPPLRRRYWMVIPPLVVILAFAIMAMVML